ncbi:hypothetical protein M3Y99_00777700 [Aphelenchoides fujianensis]|nr:hypothetical protein M3Y99_00777700 [Aphelenchoides fujianensis]
MQRIFGGIAGQTECLWATGVIQCRKNQSRVIGAIVEVYDLDRPEHGSFFNPLDPDDKVGLSLVDSETGLWQVEGRERPRLAPRLQEQARILHQGEPQVQFGQGRGVPSAGRLPSVITRPETYDHHIHQPIVLDDDYKEEADGFEVVELGSGLPEEHPRR